MFSTITTTLVNSGKHAHVSKVVRKRVNKLSTATTYFSLPVEDDVEESDLVSSSKPPSPSPPEQTSYDESDFTFSSASTSTSSLASDYEKPPPLQPPKSHIVIDEILSQNDLYQILGVSRSSRIDRLVLRRAYLSRSRACHPE